jgi:hypothetical protein
MSMTSDSDAPSPTPVGSKTGEPSRALLSEIVRDIQARWRRYIPGDRSLVDELIAERRAAAKSE